MKRRDFLAGLAAGSAIGVVDWLGWFRRFGVPGTTKTLGLADAAAAESQGAPRYLVYWFLEGGWDGYCMFNPVDTRNDGTLNIASGELNPNPGWSNQYYRPRGYPSETYPTARKQGNIAYGFLAAPGLSLFPDMAVVSSHYGSRFHSGSRWDYHYGKYSHTLSAQRQADERTVLQAFAEAKGSGFLLPHVSWHRWLSDGELSESGYPEGTGYYERLGPPHAHTIYGKTPTDMRARLGQITQLTAGAKDARIRTFVNDLHQNLIDERSGPSVRAFASAVQIHRGLVDGGQTTFNPNTMFRDAALRQEFGVTDADESVTFTSVNGQPARSKESPNTNVQAMMTYELMTAGLSVAFWIESRQVRGFDTHISRRAVLSNDGQPNQLSAMTRDLWSPLKAFVSRLKNTQYGQSGNSYWDLSTIVLCSEMGRTIQGDVAAILAANATGEKKYADIMDQDVCQHWDVSLCAFLGGKVRGNTQWGKVGSQTLDAIPILPDGSLDPAFNPDTGALKASATKSPQSFISDAGHVYATALALSDVDPNALKQAGKGRNQRQPLGFIRRT